jgi:hypothetical protein
MLKEDFVVGQVYWNTAKKEHLTFVGLNADETKSHFKEIAFPISNAYLHFFEPAKSNYTPVIKAETACTDSNPLKCGCHPCERFQGFYIKNPALYPIMRAMVLWAVNELHMKHWAVEAIWQALRYPQTCAFFTGENSIPTNSEGELYKFPDLYRTCYVRLLEAEVPEGFFTMKTRKCEQI